MKQLLFVLTFLPVAVFSQSLGLKFGPTFSNNNSSSFANSTSSGKNKSYTGINVGLIYTHNFGKLQITIEPSFVQKGFNSTFAYTDPNGVITETNTQKHIYSYFDIPISVGFCSIDKKFRYGVNLGLATSFILSAENHYTSTKYSPMDFSIKNGTRSHNLDLIAGAKAGYNISDKIFVDINLRYGTQLFTTYNYNGETSKLHYFTPCIEIGYKF